MKIGERLNEDERNNVRTMTREGYTPQNIADQCGIPVRAVRRLLSAEKIARKVTERTRQMNRRAERTFKEHAREWREAQVRGF